ncbi:hypothetical protein E4T50_14136 [Aureobasidium sp. EXF-12298]|nr:hypothetical protein E4T50_14136 [Aureobasidium sp. EXF-12298]KAI4751753.1 hypothetical protein E4T51_15039 [Aureobasidium sp. EXF-12344]KAI4770538.1 hypothetical protein E4T52_14445 [Aureobasidium sp. EXF-3400]
MDRYDAARRRQTRPGRSALGYWLPLVVTVTIATAGLAAWIWSERQQDDDDDNDRHDDTEDDTYDHPLDYPDDLPQPQDDAPDARDQPAFSDNEHWNEEAETKRSMRPAASSHATNKSKRTVAVVLNGQDQHDESTYPAEHASILSHLPENIDPAATNLFILIYAPNLPSLPELPTSTSTSTTLSSSYASVSYPASSPQPLFDSLWQKSLSLVDKPSQVMPFSTPTGYIHILRHLSPSLVYISDIPTLSGHDGEHVRQLKGWVGQTILVVGDDGAGGLLDTETETEDEESRRGKDREQTSDKWWETSDLVGLGKDVEVVDIGRLGEDWWRRVVSSN